ncbi:hypothetical protein SAMN05660657_01482 [Geodermatophilus amargosae]|uniref:Uncharacterized protein n=1 Tax=Geodermatophilus amargosae TaxID=1296565 RepID=A0A1I6YYB3_9ACTN|nr:hypothetical protein [Geodermatophilus amargosae]SFT55446.1 hypothetical protein SAMN05660657_01482 [Geodermatophilus amargosae]
MTLSGQVRCRSGLGCEDRCAGHRLQTTLHLPMSAVETVIAALSEKRYGPHGHPITVSARIRPHGTVLVAGIGTWVSPTLEVERRAPDRFRLRLTLEHRAAEQCEGDGDDPIEVVVVLPYAAALKLHVSLLRWRSRCSPIVMLLGSGKARITRAAGGTFWNGSL